jgi:hypothetical protein
MDNLVAAHSGESTICAACAMSINTTEADSLFRILKKMSALLVNDNVLILQPEKWQ